MPGASKKAALLKDAEAFLAEVRAYAADGDARTDGLEENQRASLLRRLEAMKRDFQKEAPMENILEMWISINTISALNFMVETGTLEKIPLEGSIALEQLASRVSIPATAIARLMRILCGAGIILETSPDKYAHTALSREYLPGHSVEFFRMCTDIWPCYLSLPTYFQSHTNEDLYTPTRTPFSYANKSEGKTFYEILRDNPEKGTIFNKAMKQQEPFLPTLGMFPFDSLKEETLANPSRPFIVDIGGGKGHMLAIIRDATENFYGAKAVLQDRPEVLASILTDELPGIEPMAYDFMTEEQPVRNARIYYLRRILHNYQDDTCVTILRNTAKAMGSDSRVLIGEIVLPDRVEVGGEMTAYWKDVVMLTIGGKERGESGFRMVLEEAGLELVRVWRYKEGAQGVVEARLR